MSDHHNAMILLSGYKLICRLDLLGVVRGLSSYIQQREGEGNVQTALATNK
jgi:hypothetical protein